MSFFTQEHSETNNDHGLWAEKYRPRDLSTYICDSNLKSNLKKYIDKKEIPHILFYGSPGGGKTTAAKLLTSNIPCDCLYVNASDNTGVDFIRDKIRPFAASSGFNDLKVVTLDECLDENTLVWVLRDGNEQTVKIKDLDQKNDLVKSYNINKSVIEWRPFILWEKGDQECVELELENGEVVVCTYDHKWYVYDDDSKIVKMKMSDIIDRGIEYILSPE